MFKSTLQVVLLGAVLAAATLDADVLGAGLYITSITASNSSGSSCPPGQTGCDSPYSSVEIAQPQTVVTSPAQFTVQLQSVNYAGTPTIVLQVAAGSGLSQQYRYTLPTPMTPGYVALATFPWAYGCLDMTCLQGPPLPLTVQATVLDGSTPLGSASRQFSLLRTPTPMGPFVSSTTLGFPVALCGLPCQPPPGLVVEPAASAFVNQGSDYEVTVQLQPMTFQALAVVQYRLSVGNVVYGSGSAPVALIPGRPAQLTFQDCLDCGSQLINLHGQSGTLQITVLDGATAVAHDSIGFFVP